MRWAAVWPWAALALLGVYHGVNPGMGWLFAVGRGLQERRRSAVLGALLPIALGHEVVDRAGRGGGGADAGVRAAAHDPAGCGVRPGRLRRVDAGPPARPPARLRHAGGRAGPGRVVVPDVLRARRRPDGGAGAAGAAVADQYGDLRQLGATAALAATVHVAAMLSTMAVVAVVVYEKLGLGLLRRSWFNLDLAWSVVLLLAGAVTLFSA